MMSNSLTKYRRFRRAATRDTLIRRQPPYLRRRFITEKEPLFAAMLVVGFWAAAALHFSGTLPTLKRLMRGVDFFFDAASFHAMMK